MATVLSIETPQLAFAANAEVNGKLKAKQVAPGSVMVAGKNFGCGSSRERARSCLKGYELTIVAKGLARIFLQNSINLGLDLVTAPDIEANDGDELEVTADKVARPSSTRAASSPTPAGGWWRPPQGLTPLGRSRRVPASSPVSP